MSKDKISDYSATANSNTDIGGINIDEGCAPSGINDAIRTLMKQLKDWQSGSQDVYIHPAGSASAPSITATGDTNTGLFFPAADTVGITTGGTERARVDSAGNLGLGVTPSAISLGKSFEIAKVGSGLWNNGSQGDIQLVGNYYYNSGDKFAANGYAQAFILDSGVYSWRTSSANNGSGAGAAATMNTLMTLDASGNLGVGLTSPSTYGQFAVGTVASGGWNLSGFVGNRTSTGQTVHGLAFYNNTTEIAEINIRTDGSTTGGAMLFSTASSGSLSERARIDSSGNLYLGITSSVLGGIFQLYRSNADGMTSKTDTAINNVPYFAWNAHTSGDNQFHRFYTEASYTQRGSIDYNRASNVTRYNTTSDATLKNIIGDAEANKSVEILSSTRIREYSWKSDESNKPQIGVIAQELYETFKGAVSVGGDMEKTDADGNATTEYVPWSVDKTAFTFHLVKGWQEHQRIIQEQQAIITQLQADVAALKGQA